MMAEMVFEKQFRVNTYETDTSGSLSIPGLFNYLQDAAACHASLLGLGTEQLEGNNMFWVLSRILVRIDSMPSWEEDILVKTWPRGIDKLFALRDFEIYGLSGKIYGTASSCWLMLNIKNRRPVRPDRYLTYMKESLNYDSSTGRNPVKIQGIEKPSYTSQVFPVKYSDLDINMHVNNANYVKWTVDTYPLDFIMNAKLETAEINYLSESVSGDEIAISVSELDENKFLHSVIRKNDNRELCRLRFDWKRK